MASGSDNGTQPERPIVTRFAPSPTGFLHIGGARTALFNWLYARRNGGKFLLRIEDTDRVRSTEAAIAAILDGMHWLGLDWDGHEYYQSQFWARHAEVAHELLARGHAYRCWMSQEDLAAQRERAQAERRPFRIESPWRDAGKSEGEGAFVVRLKAPREGETVIEDLVQGRVAVQNAELDDFILLRSDGTPTYMLAVVVDDHDMGVTHVVRGDDHLNNAFRQLAIIKGMGWPEPIYSHVPLIHGQDGAKLSKRHGALGVDAYRDELGILPEAMFNYLLRLGWGHGDQEEFTVEEATQVFDLSGVGKAPSRFDIKKLLSLNGHYIRHADDRRLAEIVAAKIGPQADVALLTEAMPVLKTRARDMNELADGAGFLFKSLPLTMNEQAQALLTDEARALLARISASLRAEEGWTTEALEANLKAYAEAQGLGLGKLAQPLRAALTGQTTSPGIFDVLALLGKEESLARIDAQAAG
ncbi:glutamate--tRNA ligase [Croceibacterium sp. LX-88]|uniref:Glutamate--tRNA ligase n=1 Tax=Croceibacterium selenioxidans TaxID=2838833 RepID=A0ABS5W2H3_9SPHN|nr:glutamate--tRNA ligase [Croceibacterium selenioxidans]MBT2133849.1 glutamate--tRNA ligase [Croceibacterium selenioxidans]